MNGGDNEREMVRMKKLIILCAALMMLSSIPAAMAITVDGDESDWIDLLGVKSIEDPAYDVYVTPPVGSDYYINWDSGYEMTKFAIYYEASTDTLYFKYNTSGVPGDTDGDGDPNGYTNSSRAVGDAFEVSVGNFIVMLDLTGDGTEDYRVIYTQDSIFVKSGDESEDYTANFTTEHSIGGGLTPAYQDSVVEASICPAHNLTGFGDCDKSITVLLARCGSANDYASEDSVGPLAVNEPPVAVPVGTNVCKCTDTDFDGSASYDPNGTIVSYEWGFGDGNTGSGETTSHHYATPGTYTVTLTVTDDFGISCSNTTEVEVYEWPTAKVFANPSSVYEPGGDVTFSATVSGGTPPYNCTWTIGGFTYAMEIVQSGQQPTAHTVFVSEDTTAILNVLDAHNCPATDEVTVPVRQNGIEVPALTPAGLIGLIGLLGIIGIIEVKRRD